MPPTDDTANTTRLPGIGTIHLPLTRNDLLLLLVALTEFGLGVETFLAHLISGGIRPEESIPIFSGPLAGLIMLVALALRVRNRQRPLLPSLLVVGAGGYSVVVGVLGTAFHWSRALPPINLAAPVFNWDWIIYAPPVAGPLSFAGVGLLAIIALLEDTTPETGRLTLPGLVTFQTPLPQTSQFLWLVAFGLYAATLSSLLDHARTSFTNPFVWTPVVLGVFASVVTTLLALYERRTERDFFIFFWTMLLMVGLGVLGLGLHINADLPEGEAGLVLERFIRGAPVMAPMLFAIMGAFGIFAIINADTTTTELPENTQPDAIA